MGRHLAASVTYKNEEGTGRDFLVSRSPYAKMEARKQEGWRKEAGSGPFYLHSFP